MHEKTETEAHANDLNKIDNAHQKEEEDGEIQEGIPPEKQGQGIHSSEDCPKAQTFDSVPFIFMETHIQPAHKKSDKKKTQISGRDQVEKILLLL